MKISGYIFRLYISIFDFIAAALMQQSATRLLRGDARRSLPVFQGERALG